MSSGQLPCLDSPPPGTACSRCGREIQLWKPEFCGPCFEHDMELLVSARQIQEQDEEPRQAYTDPGRAKW
jgi:hypothetical protein